MFFFISISENIVFSATVVTKSLKLRILILSFSMWNKNIMTLKSIIPEAIEDKTSLSRLVWTLFYSENTENSFLGHGFDLENVLKLRHNFIRLDNIWKHNSRVKKKRREVFLFHEATISPETRYISPLIPCRWTYSIPQNQCTQFILRRTGKTNFCSFWN